MEENRGMIFKSKITESISKLLRVINKVPENREQRKWTEQNHQRNDKWKISSKGKSLQTKRKYHVLSTMNERKAQGPKPHSCKISGHWGFKDVPKSFQAEKLVIYKDMGIKWHHLLTLRDNDFQTRILCLPKCQSSREDSVLLWLGAIPEYHRVGGLNNRSELSHSSEEWESKIEVQQD